MSDLAVIIPAAGSSSRFGGADKLVAPLQGDQPVIALTLRTFLKHASVGLVVLATRESVPWSDPRVAVCKGGASRAETVRNALAIVPREFEWVAVHDAARPLVSQRLIDDVLAAAQRYGAAIPAVPVVPSIKQADGPLPAKVQRTVPRRTLWAVQTPQVMRRAALEAAYAACGLPLEQVTDEAQLLELAGQDVWLVPGEERNLKITTPDDLRLARALLAEDGRR
ncbi:MAG TPA: 2-C-methyl-D-erythritol 4-phosphate cytidylyltransferase [Tepidisphaeraceae bacterium]|nr:2-C-methyl-D-erythritol 4-phosphate cytidylyltransferase [Tepidisphaeraceae bacterium]